MRIWVRMRLQIYDVPISAAVPLDGKPISTGEGVNELHSDTLWKTIKQLAKKARVKRAAVAYITSDEVVQFGNEDILVTDASDAAIAAGQTDAEVLARAKERGAELYSLDSLHTKVMLLDGVAVIGSANLSASSANSLVEAAWVSDSPAAVAMVGSLVEQLAGYAEPINDAFIERIRKIAVAKKFIGAGKKPTVKIKLAAHQTWIVGVHELFKDFPEEANAIAEGETIADARRTRERSSVGWIRWTGNSTFRNNAQKGHSIIQIWSKHNAKRPEAVYRHAPILHRQDEARCTRFYVESFANAEETTLTWGQFRKLLNQVDLPAKIGPTSARSVSERHAEALFTLWGQ
jgi:hypothetical protein